MLASHGSGASALTTGMDTSGKAKSPGRPAADGVNTPLPNSSPKGPPTSLGLGPAPQTAPGQTFPMRPPPPPLRQPQQMPFTGLTGMMAGLNVDQTYGGACGGIPPGDQGE